MAMNTSGNPLTPDEVAEYTAYGNRGLRAPEKFDGVVFDNTTAAGAQYRYATADEAKASKAADDAAQKAAEDAKALNARIDADVAKAAAKAANVAPPAKPE